MKQRKRKTPIWFHVGFWAPLLVSWPILAEEAWRVCAVTVAATAEESPSVLVRNVGESDFSVDVFSPGGIASFLAKAGEENRIRLKRGGPVRARLNLAGVDTYEIEGTLEAGQEWVLRAAYAGPPVEVPEAARLEAVPVEGAAEIPDLESMSPLERIQWLEAHRDENPSFPRALAVCCNNHALGLAKQRKWEEAEAYLNRALQIDSEDPGFLRNRATVLNNWAVCLAEENRYVEAEAVYSRLLALPDQANEEGLKPVRGNYARLLVAWGVKESAAGLLDSALLRFRKATMLAPENLSAWVQAGEAWYDLDKLEEAAACYEKALALGENAPIRSRYDQILRELSAGDFESRESGNFRILFQGNQRKELARVVLEIARDARREVGSFLRHYPRTEYTILLYTTGQFRGVTGLDEWAGAAYDGKMRLRVDDADLDDEKALRERLRQQVFHEYCHAVIYDLGGSAVPGWLHEGLAQLAEPDGALTDREKAMLEERSGSLVSFGGLTAALITIPDPEKVRLAYCQSKAFTHFLIERYGKAKVLKLLRQLKQGEAFERTFRDTYGASLEETEAQWQRGL